MAGLRTPKSKSVFVVHGRNADARRAMFDFLRSIELRPIEWSQARDLTGEASPLISTILDSAFEHAQAVVVLFTPDEIVALRNEYADGVVDPDLTLAAQSRPNVLFEAGMAMGRDSRRTVLVELGRMRSFSDILGRHILRINNEHTKRQELALRLKTAGCDIDITGHDWYTSGNFVVPPDLPDHLSFESHPDLEIMGGTGDSNSSPRKRRREVR